MSDQEPHRALRCTHASVRISQLVVNQELFASALHPRIVLRLDVELEATDTRGHSVEFNKVELFQKGVGELMPDEKQCLF